MKKILSFLLVLCMLLSIVPATMLTVFAEEGYANALPSASFDRNNPAIKVDENDQIILPEGWSFVAHSTSDYDTELPLVTVYNDYDGTVETGLVDGYGCIVIEGSGRGESARIPVRPSDDPWFHGANLGIGGHVNWNAAYAYQAPATGKVSIDIDEIISVDIAKLPGQEGWGAPSYVALFVDGKMVWPTADGSYTNVAAWAAIDDMLATKESLNPDLAEGAYMKHTGDVLKAPELLEGITVEKGQRIELMVKCDDAAGAIYLGWTISYTEMLKEPTVNASVALGEKFAIKFDVEHDANATEWGVYVNNVKQADGYVIEDLVAAELGAAAFLYAPYQVIDGKEIKADVKRITALDILAQYTAENGYDEKTVALAEATILYASMAEAYFEEFDLDEELKAIVDAMAAPEAKNAKITDAIEETATFIRANLYLNDSMDMKFFFTAENASDLTVKVEGAGDVTVTVEEAGSGYVAIVEDIPMSAYGTDLKVTVYDGETAISETLTYSVEIYAARMYEADATGIDQLALNDLLKTIVNLSKAAAAYNA